MTQPERENEPFPVEILTDIRPVTPEEIARRRRLFKEAMRLRDKIVLRGVSTADLIQEDRDELE